MPDRLTSSGAVQRAKKMVNWGSVPEWLDVALIITIQVLGFYSISRRRKKDRKKYKPAGIPEVIPESLRRQINAVFALYGAGGFMVGITLLLSVYTLVAATAGWLTSSFPAGEFFFAAILFMIVGYVLIHAGWSLRMSDDRIGESIRRGFGYWGVRPDVVKKAFPLRKERGATKPPEPQPSVDQSQTLDGQGGKDAP